MKKYKNIAYVIPYHLKDTGNVSSYFINNTENYYIYILPSTYRNRPSIFIHYKNGLLFSKKENFIYRGNNKAIILLFYYLNYLYFLYTFHIKESFIIVSIPQLCVLSSMNKYIFSNDTVLWIWDYFPTKNGLLKIYHWFINYYNIRLKYVLYLSPELMKIYSLGNEKIRKVVVFGVDNISVLRQPKKRIVGYIGNLRKGQGLEILMQALSKDKTILLEIVGDGELIKELKEYIARKKLHNRVIFHGFVDNDDLVKIVSKWSIGTAIYDPDVKCITRYTDPSKVKLYMEYEIPVIMTKITYLYNLLKKEKGGVGIEYTPEAFLEAVSKIENNYSDYQRGIKKMKKDFEYNKIYAEGFNILIRK